MESHWGNVKETPEWEGKASDFWPLGSLEGHSRSWTIYLYWDWLIFWAILDWANVGSTLSITAPLVLLGIWWHDVHSLTSMSPLSNLWLLHCWPWLSTSCYSLAAGATSNLADVSNADNYTKFSSLLQSHDQLVALQWHILNFITTTRYSCSLSSWPYT